MELTNENYYEHNEYMSVSQFKSFLDCPAETMAEIKGEYKRETTTALLVGSYVDAYVEGTLEQFIDNHLEILNSRTRELKADYRHANKMIERFTRDEFFMSYLEGEKQVIMTADLFGCKWKCKIDVLADDKIVDFKTTRDFERVYGVSFIEHWQYDKQMAVYQKIVELNTGKKLPCYIAAVTKEKTPDIAIIEIPQWRLNEALEEVEKAMPRILNIKNGIIEAEMCGKCDYCKTNKVLDKVVGFDDI